MSISIKVTNKRAEKWEGIYCVDGIIKFNNFEESLIIPVNWWTMEDYERQWKEGLERIKTHDTSCLVVEVFFTNYNPVITWWLLYKEGDKIFIRNNLIAANLYRQRIGNNSFTPENCYEFIHTRRIAAGNIIPSEWVIDAK